MELRKAEQEVDRLKSQWKSLRRQKACYNDSGSTVDLLKLPPWKDLVSRIGDDIFPVMPAEEAVVENTLDVGETGVAEEPVEAEKATDLPKEEEQTAYSEWGMLITGASTEPDTKEKPAAQPEQASAATKESDEESDEEDTSVINSPPNEVLAQLQSLCESCKLLQPKIDKFMARLTERDPITKKPRYGDRAVTRAKKIIRIYKALEIAVSIVLDNNGVLQSIDAQVKHHEEQLQAQAKAIQTAQHLEAERLEQERRNAEQRAKEHQIQVEAARKKEEEELAQLAHEARLRRLDGEQHAIDAEANADRELLALVPVKGADGVRMQIDRMRSSLKDDKKSLDVALGSLYILFDQIVRKPEEVNFRRIRRDHPKFMEDIGRHIGGKEVLIAAGFSLEKLDGVPSFFSKEPNIESDMDGWSDWFDGLKKTLEVIEEEMIK